MNPANPRAQVVLLGARPAVRDGVASAMAGVDAGTRVLDWLLRAFSALDEPDVTVVAGYRAEDILDTYPELRVVINRDWATTGSLHSFGLVPPRADHDLYVSYADVVFHPEAVRALRDASGDVVIAVDSQWRDRYDGRSRRALKKAEKVSVGAGRVVAVGGDLPLTATDAEFVGVARFSPAAAAVVRAAREQDRFPATAGLTALLQHLVDEGLSVSTVDLEGNWAELDARQDLARFVLGTKAESLERLRTMAHGGSIGAQVAFTQQEWDTSSDTVIARIIDVLGTDTVIVRSSAVTEDTWNESGAGRHESILDVAPEPAALRAAIDSVLASYGEPLDVNQVLVQAMLHDVASSGVVMTRTHALGAPYYVLNFDDRSSRTDTVTSGQDARTIMLLRGHDISPVEPSLRDVVDVIGNIERLVGHDALDIEFAVTNDATVHVLQVRPIAIDHLAQSMNDSAVFAAVDAAAAFLQSARHTGRLLGDGPYFSVMTDWNPAEIIGTKPRRLSLSLYRHLITDDVWATQRAEYGYRDVRPCPLLTDVVGHPYVDVRASFNSFVPAALPDPLAARLVNHELATLRANPNLHDKVEFDVVVTCMTPDFPERAAALLAAGFSESEIELIADALRAITTHGIERIEADTAAIQRVREQQAVDALVSGRDIDRAHLHIERARGGATLVFSHLARGAFVATDLLRGLVAVGAIGSDRRDEFLASTETVFGRLQRDAALVHSGTLSWDDFVDRYGHLRPGTYDITSPTYRDLTDLYLAPAVDAATATHEPAVFAWTPAEAAAIEQHLAACGVAVSAATFDRFARLAIAGREEAKFVFTKSLSDGIEAIAAWGATVGLDRDALSHLTIHDVYACRDAVADLPGFLRERCAEGAAALAITQALCLPGQLVDPYDVFAFEQPEAEANFITQRTAEARAVDIGSDPHASVEGAIVLIPSADPGYDGLLARGIAGLVTMYGGANSHMAVRAAETGIPAAIGVGEQRFRELTNASIIRLECGTRRLVVVA